jgi:hypothetical protein
MPKSVRVSPLRFLKTLALMNTFAAGSAWMLLPSSPPRAITAA